MPTRTAKGRKGACYDVEDSNEGDDSAVRGITPDASASTSQGMIQLNDSLLAKLIQDTLECSMGCSYAGTNEV